MNAFLMRYMDSVGTQLSNHRKQEKNELRRYKESAMLDQIQEMYEKRSTSKDPEASEKQEAAKSKS